jgi:uncharacterized membrane protein YeaQ/YmgE (transglycosylase-associated protein family)
MTEFQIAGTMIYLLIGYFLADILLVKVDSFYWYVMFLYPLFLFSLVGALVLLKVIDLIIRIKNYEVKERLQ